MCLSPEEELKRHALRTSLSNVQGRIAGYVEVQPLWNAPRLVRPGRYSLQRVWSGDCRACFELKAGCSVEKLATRTDGCLADREHQPNGKLIAKAISPPPSRRAATTATVAHWLL
jgi:hypothetical protein